MISTKLHLNKNNSPAEYRCIITLRCMHPLFFHPILTGKWYPPWFCEKIPTNRLLFETLRCAPSMDGVHPVQHVHSHTLVLERHCAMIMLWSCRFARLCLPVKLSGRCEISWLRHYSSMPNVLQVKPSSYLPWRRLIPHYTSPGTARA